MASPTYYESAGRILEEQLKNADGFERQLAVAQVCSNLALVDSLNALRAEVANLREGSTHQANTLVEIKNLLSQIGMRLAS